METGGIGMYSSIVATLRVEIFSPAFLCRKNIGYQLAYLSGLLEWWDFRVELLHDRFPGICVSLIYISSS